jgi:tetraacyldisaccharide 4'-kinase
VICIRNLFYDNGWLVSTEFQIPVISVGNITVGGTGKTPHVEYLAGLLKEEYRVAVLSRGYRRKTRDFRIARPGSITREFGDESAQISFRFPDITVAVDRDRVHGVSELIQLEPPVEAIILDDAFQHRSIRPGLSILLEDYHRPMERDFLLPAGMLREPAVNLRRADMILVAKCPGEISPDKMDSFLNRPGFEPGKNLFFTTIEYGGLIPVFSGTPLLEPGLIAGKMRGVLIVSGIARPGTLREYAMGFTGSVAEIRFPDHHFYSLRDLERIGAKMKQMDGTDRNSNVPPEGILVLTTEKDAVKLREQPVPEFIRKALYAVRIRVEFLNHDQEHFDRKIKSYVKSSKRSGILHPEKNP